MSDIICTNCKTFLKTKDRYVVTYVKADEKDLQVWCENCIKKDIKENESEWNYIRQQWNYGFTNIEKLFYDMDVSINQPKEMPYYAIEQLKWHQIEFSYQWRIVQSIRTHGQPTHLFVDRNCKKCKKSVNNSKGLEYGYYQWGIESEILCRDCINRNKKKDEDEWDSIEHMWDSHWSHIERLMYFMSIKREAEIVENRLTDISIDKMGWDELDLVHQWCIVRSVQDSDFETDEKNESRPLDICQVTQQDIHPDKTIFIKDNGEDSLVCTCHHIPIAVRNEITNMIPHDPTSREIFAFIKCEKCVEEEEPVNIECGWTKTGFLVRCITHDIQITHFPMPPELIPVGCNCPSCKEKEK